MREIRGLGRPCLNTRMREMERRTGSAGPPRYYSSQVRKKSSEKTHVLRQMPSTAMSTDNQGCLPCSIPQWRPPNSAHRWHLSSSLSPVRGEPTPSNPFSKNRTSRTHPLQWGGGACHTCIANGAQSLRRPDFQPSLSKKEWTLHSVPAPLPTVTLPPMPRFVTSCMHTFFDTEIVTQALDSSWTHFNCCSTLEYPSVRKRPRRENRKINSE